VVACAAAGNNVEKFVLISTDKAINPTSVMGPPSASPKWSARHCQPQADGIRDGALGNVFGSTGSVIPKFANRSQPWSGDGHASRFGVTSCRFRRRRNSLQAGLMGNGGEISLTWEAVRFAIWRAS
jgi:hypothetical protein